LKFIDGSTLHKFFTSARTLAVELLVKFS
jgi:hypothetical protein